MIAKLHEFEGHWLEVKEIACITGYTRRYIDYLVKKGLPLKRKRNGGGHATKHMYKGQMRTVREIAADLGVSTVTVYDRLYRGTPLESPVREKQSRRYKAAQMLESGEYATADDHGENGKFWADDLEARVWHLYCGGDDFGECTLVEIAALWNLSRERVRQVEDSACRKIRGLAARGNPDAVAACEFFRARMESLSREQPTVWEQASLNAPGNFDLTDFNDNTSYADIARKFGHAEYETQPHVVASRTAAARRARRA